MILFGLESLTLALSHLALSPSFQVGAQRCQHEVPCDWPPLHSHLPSCGSPYTLQGAWHLCLCSAPSLSAPVASHPIPPHWLFPLKVFLPLTSRITYVVTAPTGGCRAHKAGAVFTLTAQGSQVPQRVMWSEGPSPGPSMSDQL